MNDKIRVYCQSLGCDKTLCDSEHMAGNLIEEGYIFTDEPENADIAIVNTCCFIHDAQQESVDEILSLAELKKEGSLKGLIVTGCLAERFKDDITKEIPEVDAVLGTMAIEDMPEAVDKVLKGERFSLYPDIDSPLPKGRNFDKRQLSSGGHYAYLKIAEGCNRRCTYCVIPYVRGKYRSIPMEELLEEAGELASRGVKELILVAQETTLYGIDLYGKKTLPDLLREIAKIDGIEWIRLLYTYPEEIDDELIRTMKDEPKIVRYIDMPIQHCADGVLKRMGRHIDKAGIISVIGRLREAMPDICIRTTLITGFPGETQEDFEELYRFVNDTEFDRLGVFTYSREDGTPAARMEDQIPEDISAKRRDEIMELQQEIAFEKAQSYAESLPVIPVFVEGFLPDDNVYVGRTYKDAPDVDGLIFIKDAGRELMSGSLVKVRVDGAMEYDLTGEIYDDDIE